MPSSVPALSYETYPQGIALVPALQRFSTPAQSAPILLAPQLVRSGGHRCSPALLGLAGFLHSSARHESLSHTVPLSLFEPMNLTIPKPLKPQGFLPEEKRRFPVRDANPSDLPDRRPTTTSLRSDPSRTIFSSPWPLASYETREPRLCERCELSCIGRLRFVSVSR
jgi:hypothetical protein